MAQVTLNSEKFGALFTSMERQLVMQSSFLESMYNMQVARFNFEKDRAKDEARDRERAKLQAEESAKKISDDAGQRGGPSGDPDLSREQKENLLGALLPGIGTLIGSAVGTLGGLSLANAGRFMFKGGAALVLGPHIGEFVAGFIEEGLSNFDLSGIGLDGDDKAVIANSLGKAAKFAVYGSIFGKRGALIAAGGSLAGDVLTKAIFGDDVPENIFGTGLTAADAMSIGSMIGLAFGPSLIKRSFFSGANAPLEGDERSPRLKGTLRRVFSNRFASRALAAGGILAVGGIIGDAINNEMGSTEGGDAINKIANFAAFGSIFGVKGALIGAAVGGLIVAGGAMMNWMKNRSDKYKAQVLNDADAAIREAEEKFNAGQHEAAQAAIEEGNERIGAYLRTVGRDADAAIQRAQQASNIARALADSAQTDLDRMEALKAEEEALRNESYAQNSQVPLVTDVDRNVPGHINPSDEIWVNAYNYMKNQLDQDKTLDAAIAETTFRLGIVPSNDNINKLRRMFSGSPGMQTESPSVSLPSAGISAEEVLQKARSIISDEDFYFALQSGLVPKYRMPLPMGTQESAEKSIREIIENNEARKRLSLLQTASAGFQPEVAGQVGAVALVEASKVLMDAGASMAQSVGVAAQAAAKIRGGGGGLGFAMGNFGSSMDNTLRAGMLPFNT